VVYGRPPTDCITCNGTPDHHYTWTLGVDMYGGGGQVGQKDYYGSAAFGVRVKGDYLINAANKFGAQSWISITHLGKGNMQTSSVDQLDVFDIGIGLYKHFCSGHFCITPLAGAQLALFAPGSQQDSAGSKVFDYTAVGGRLELAASYAFGPRYEHVISAMVGANVYTSVFASPSDCATNASCASDIGLNKGGALGYLGLGYTYRFNSPLGSAPFVTLE
jgi:hypothetical protein